MHLCFFCYTPFHVFNAINVKDNLYRNDEADLYLYNNYTGGTFQLYKNLKRLGLFRRIYIINDTWWQRNRKLRKLWVYYTNLRNKNRKILNARRNYKKLVKQNHVYDIVWSYGSAMEMYIILGISLRNNPQTLYYCYEEGEGSYRIPCTNFLSENEIRFLSEELKIQMPDIPNKMLFYLPECVSPVITATIEKMPTVNFDLYNRVYSNVWETKTLSLPYNAYIMAAGGYDQSFTLSIYDTLCSALNLKVCVKAHPRFTTPFANQNIELLECGTMPWEIICGGIDDIESKLLIGVYSTAMVTAKSVYGKEPYLVFLNDMDILSEDQKISDEMSDFLNHFIQTYSDESKIFFPKNTDELTDYISVWKNREYSQNF